jgi:hypothetical protein
VPSKPVRGGGEELIVSWNKQHLIVAASLIVATSVPTFAEAQRRGPGGGGGRAPRVVVSRPVVVSPFYSGFYRPYYSPFFWDVYGWGYPGIPAFGFGPYNRGFAADSSARIQVTPRHAEVYVDGYRAGIVDDFDGFAQRLRVPAGEHVIELYLDGHKSISEAILFAPGESYRIRHTMEPLGPNDPDPMRPMPKPGAAPGQRLAFDAFGQPVGPSTAPAPAMASGRDGAALLIRVQPGDASITVDGERWQSSGDRLEIQVTPGEHRIEIQKDGYQPFSTTVRVRPGESSPINVSLTRAGEDQ